MSKGVYKKYGAAIGMQVLYIGKTNKHLKFMETYTVCDVYRYGYHLTEIKGFGFLRENFLLLTK